jgi:hypothetical protein
MIARKEILGAIVGLSMLVVGSTAGAVTLVPSGANYVGSINDGIPSNPDNEVIYINNLITLAINESKTIGTEDYSRSNSTAAGPFPTAVEAGNGKIEGAEDLADSTITLAGKFKYILGKYDAGEAGSYVWYFADGISGDITLPSTFNGKGLSHISWYNPGGGGGFPMPEPGTLALLGLGLIGLGAARRKA